MKIGNIVLDNHTLVLSLRSTLCPSCGDVKRHAQTFCTKCYRSLPIDLRRALYRRLGNGYDIAVYDALMALDCRVFKSHPIE